MELNQTVSGATDSTSGAVENNEQEEAKVSGATEVESEENNAYKRLLKEKKIEAEKRKSLEAELKALKEKEMLEKENYKELLKHREEELNQLKTKAQEYELARKRASVNSSLRDELIKLGVDAKHMDTALKLIDRDKVMVDEDTGVVIGADMAAKTFYQKNADLGFFKKGTPGVNHNAPDLNVSDSKEAYKAELAKCKTQAEIEAVMNKYRGL